MQLSEEQKEKHLVKWVSSVEGRIALTILREVFYDVPSYDDNPYRMAAIGGEREVIEYLLDKQED